MTWSGSKPGALAAALLVSLAGGPSAMAQPAGQKAPPGPPTHSLDFGELYFGFTFKASYLHITNDCPYEVPVFIDLYDLPFTLDIPRVIRAKPGENSIRYQITTPPPPPMPVFPVMAPLPHGIYAPMDGTIVIENAEVHACPPCFRGRKIIQITGHMHWPVLAPPPPPSMEALDCGEFWRQGRPPPPNLRELCEDPMRGFAALYAASELKPYVESDPDAWDWLPTGEEILEMSIEDLIAMKRRAEEQRDEVDRSAAAQQQATR